MSMVNANMDWRLAAVLVVGVVVVHQLLKKDITDTAAVAGDALKAAGGAVNPLNNKNAAASTVNAVGQALGTTSYEQAHWTLGGWLYDLKHGTRTTKGGTAEFYRAK